MNDNSIKKHCIAPLLMFVCFGIISLSLGQDANWDLSNYHYYNAYAFLNNRFAYDFAPAQIQTFHNPILYLPIYWLIKFFPPKVVGFILGGIQGLNIALILYIAKACLKRTTYVASSSLLLFFIVITSASSPLFISEIGTTFGDNLVSLFTLTSLLLILKNNSRNELSLATLFSSGLLMGCGAGLKLTNISYVIATIVTVTFLSIGPYLWKILLCFATGILLGFLLCGGYWMYILYSYYENPFFPYYNEYFKSEYFAVLNFKDTRWLPKSMSHAFLYPFLWAWGNHPSLEIPFRDIRWAIAVCLSLIGLILGLIAILVDAFSGSLYKISAKPRPSQVQACLPFNHNSSMFILLFTSISFILWLFTFGYSRYLMPLDLLCPIYILCVSNHIAKLCKQIGSNSLKVIIVSPRFMQSILGALFIIIVLMVDIPNWGRTLWRETWFGPISSTNQSQENSIVLMFSNEPTSYVIPFLPAHLRFVRVQGNLFADRRFTNNTKLQGQLKQILEIKGAEYYSLSPLQTPPTSSDLADMGFTQNQKSCEYLYPYNATLQLCRLSRL